MTEGQVLQNAIRIGFIKLLGRAETAAAFGAFTLEQMAFAGARAHDFSTAGDFKTFGHRFSGFYPFGSSHKFIFLLKRARNIGNEFCGSKRQFSFREHARMVVNS